jgi:hypothetical protein
MSTPQAGSKRKRLSNQAAEKLFFMFFSKKGNARLTPGARKID